MRDCTWSTQGWKSLKLKKLETFNDARKTSQTSPPGEFEECILQIKELLNDRNITLGIVKMLKQKLMSNLKRNRKHWQNKSNNLTLSCHKKRFDEQIKMRINKRTGWHESVWRRDLCKWKQRRFEKSKPYNKETEPWHWQDISKSRAIEESNK